MGAPTRRPVDALAGIEQELVEERATALGRIGRNLEALLADLAALCERIGRADGDARDRLLADYRGVRERALEQRWYLLVQREACGLRDAPGYVEELYPIPLPPPRR